MHKYAAQFHALFRGREDAYGRFILSGKRDERGKQLGEGRPVFQQLTDERWEQHLEGKGTSIGVVPVEPNTNLCWWGCIDNDDYPLDTKYWLKEVARLKYPLIICNSKSGGAHFFLFLAKPMPAKQVQACISTMAANLKLGGKEIYPKQSKVGHLGSWLNMPYFGSTRRCITLDGELDAEGFLKLAFAARINRLPNLEETTDFPDCPPCLDSLVKNGGCGTHEKHNTLFNFAVYLKQAHPDDWEERLHVLNSDPAIFPTGGHNKIDDILKAMSGTDYNYLCSEPPIKKWCNRPVCVTRRFGVSKGTSACMPTELILVPDGRMTVTYAKVQSKGQEKEIEVANADDLFDPNRFATLAFNQIQDFPVFPKKQTKFDWITYIKGLPTTVLPATEIFEDTLLNLLREHCLSQITYERDDLLVNDKAVYFDRKNQRAFFKPAPVAKVLNVTRPTLERLVKRQGGDNGYQVYFKSRINHRFSYMPIDKLVEEIPEIASPAVEEEPT